jgi:hypothetical protein
VEDQAYKQYALNVHTDMETSPLPRQPKDKKLDNTMPRGKNNRDNTASPMGRYKNNNISGNIS